MNLNYFWDTRMVKVIVNSKKFGSLLLKLKLNPILLLNKYVVV